MSSAGNAARGGSLINTKPLMAPSVILLLLWMLAPLLMTLYFSTLRYTFLNQDNIAFVGLANYRHFATDPSLWTAVGNTVCLVGGVLVASIV
ncbi:MAG: sugar ABC transporter permease, partial [Planctomycetota bacterium]|nr:sugar ABC transporter permease [Planctomycetota bacterium]